MVSDGMIEVVSIGYDGMDCYWCGLKRRDKILVIVVMLGIRWKGCCCWYGEKVRVVMVVSNNVFLCGGGYGRGNGEWSESITVVVGKGGKDGKDNG